MARRSGVRHSCQDSELGGVCADLFRAFDTDKNGFLDAAEATMLLGSALVLQASVLGVSVSELSVTGVCPDVQCERS